MSNSDVPVYSTGRPSACACFPGEQQPFTLTFPYVAYRQARRSVPRRCRRCISACDRVSAEYDRPRETRSKTTDTFPRLSARARVRVPARSARNSLPIRERADVRKRDRLSLHVFIFGDSRPNRENRSQEIDPNFSLPVSPYWKVNSLCGRNTILAQRKDLVHVNVNIKCCH